MAVDWDATHTESIRTDTSDPYAFNYTPSGTPRAIILGAAHGVASTDHIVGVTYGGVAMSRVVTATDTSTEPGRAYIYFLGRNIPTGLQSVSVDLASATGDDIHFVVASMTANSDTQVIDSDSISENAANPTVTLQKGGLTGGSWCIMYGGGAAPGGTLATGNTLDHTHDLTAFYSQACYETTIDNADHTIGWSTLGTDDLAFVACCIAETEIPIQAHAPYISQGWEIRNPTGWNS
jgi:hypothetical protein